MDISGTFVHTVSFEIKHPDLRTVKKRQDNLVFGSLLSTPDLPRGTFREKRKRGKTLSRVLINIWPKNIIHGSANNGYGCQWWFISNDLWILEEHLSPSFSLLGHCCQPCLSQCSSKFVHIDCRSGGQFILPSAEMKTSWGEPHSLLLSVRSDHSGDEHSPGGLGEAMSWIDLLIKYSSLCFVVSAASYYSENEIQLQGIGEPQGFKTLQGSDGILSTSEHAKDK